MRRLLLLIVLLCLLLPSSAFAFRPKGIVHLGFGSYSITTEEAAVYGSQTNLGFKYLFHENYAWFTSLGLGSAQGTWESANGFDTQEITESHAEGVLGFEVRANLSDEQELEPFFGLGVVGQAYEYDFAYSGSTIGTTSGAGAGPHAMLGIRMGIGEHFMIIPEYYYTGISLKTEAGESLYLAQQGFALAFVGRF